MACDEHVSTRICVFKCVCVCGGWGGWVGGRVGYSEGVGTVHALTHGGGARGGV
jgi:hypothetical protein